jgi:hypothetical protein
MATALLAIRPKDGVTVRRAQLVAILGLGFYLLRVASTTASLAIAADEQEEKLEALDHIPVGARVATMVGEPCGAAWALPRDSHVGAMVIVRRQGFTNDQWVMEGLNLLDLRYAAAGHFAADPSQRVRPVGCATGPLWSIDMALREVPRKAFDFVWLIEPPPFDRQLVADLRPVWRGTDSVLYQVPKERP